MKKLILLLLLGLVALSSSFAAVPTNFSIQGKLFTSDDKPVANGIFSVRVNIYYTENGAQPDWAIDVPSISIVNGLFNIVLDAEAVGVNNDKLDFSKPLFFALQPQGETELKPRLRIGSVPFALSTEHSSSATIADTAKSILGGTLPIGTVLSFAGKPESIPSNFMVCDGSALISKNYPELFTVLGNSWGDGSDDSIPETDFNLPDLRGMFLRGVDNSSQFDKDASSRLALKTGGNTGSNVGSYQRDQSNSTSNIEQSLTGIPSFDTSPQPEVNNFNGTYSSNGTLETRPKNVAVYYIIKPELFIKSRFLMNNIRKKNR